MADIELSTVTDRALGAEEGNITLSPLHSTGEKDSVPLVVGGARGGHEMVSTGESAQKDEHAKSGWMGITMIIIASFVGTGVLSLGFAAAAIGWIPTMFVIVICASGAYYSGMLYYRLYCVVPTAKVLADVGMFAHGRRGEQLVIAVAYTYLGGIVIVFHLTTASAFKNIFYDANVCTVIWSILGGFLSLGLAQFRDIHEIGGLAIFGAISIFIPVIVVFSVLIANGHTIDAQMHDDDNDYDDATSIVAPVNGFEHFVTFGVGCMDIVFAFSGQVVFFELISGMSTPSDFKKSVAVSTAVMTFTYITVASLGYAFVGASGLIGGNPITSVLSNGPILRVVNSFLVCHVIVAYVIELNILTRGVLKIINMENGVNGDTPHDRFIWFSCTGCIVFGAFIISNLIPFFSDIMGLLGSLCSILLTYTIPLVCAQKLLPMKPFEYKFASYMIPFSIAMAIFGTFCSIVDIVEKFDVDSPPFSC